MNAPSPRPGAAPPPSVPAEAREDLLALKAESAFVCSRRDGDIVPGRASGEGFYVNDTRHLSELRLTVGGAEPVLLSSTMESGCHAVINATNPELRDPGARTAQDELSIRRTILVAEDLHVVVRLRNFGRAPLTTEIALVLAADFADVFEVRGMERRTSGNVQPATAATNGLRFSYVAGDGGRRETAVRFSPMPESVAVDGASARVAWTVHVASGAAVELNVAVSAGVDDRTPITTPHVREAAARSRAEFHAWAEAGVTAFSDNELFDRLIDASTRDLHALMLPVGAARLPAAGIPWYVAPFGRDALLAAHESLLVHPDVARGTLLALAGLQATADDAWLDAEPGKILHELRSGELARTGAIPHAPYYGTADATPLFLMLAAEYFRWTDDVALMRALTPAFDAALTWIDEWGDRDGDGFVEYQRRSPAGLQNQGWKDSHDAIMHADGSLAEGSIALVEVQGYVYAAKRGIAAVYEALGQPDRARALRAEAERLRQAFNAVFWDDDEGFFALALDGRKAQVRSVASNPAHCLFAGIVDDDKAALVAERLMAPDMYSGWGIRTLSSRARAYNPMSYHNGSVWPHDNVIAAAGLKRYGFESAVEQIATGLFDIGAGARDHRLPELLCGFGRDESRATVAYPVACIPQAWAAAAPFLLLQTMLGISPDAVHRRLTVERPRLPDWIGTLELHGIGLGGAGLSLAFGAQEYGATGCWLLSHRGGAQVVIGT